MGYRSQVRSLIYGDPDKINALLTKHQLLGKDGMFDHLGKDIRRYTIIRRLWVAIDPHVEPETSAPLEPGPLGEYRELDYEVIDLYGDDWKWYDSYPAVVAWTELLIEAFNEWELNTEFVRIGEDDDDTEVDRNIADDGDPYLSVGRGIVSEIEPPDDPSAEDPPAEEEMVPLSALLRANRLIEWMSPHIGKMAPGAYTNCYAELNEHGLFMQEIEHG